MRVVTPKDARRMPWANGLGTTVEVASDAVAADAPWTWRLSIADLPTRAAFSNFPGIDRWISCLEGDGMRIARNGVWSDVTRAGDSFAFAGEEIVEGEPIGSGVRDVNWFLRRDRWRGGMRVIREGHLHQCEGDVVLVLASGGSATINCEGETRELAEGFALQTAGRVGVEGDPRSTVVVAWAVRNHDRESPTA